MVDVKIFWSFIPGVTSYRVDYKLQADGSWTTGPSTTDNNAIIAALTLCSYYDIRIIGICPGQSDVNGPTYNLQINDGSCC